MMRSNRTFVPSLALLISSVEVTTATSGGSIDADGYTVRST